MALTEEQRELLKDIAIPAVGTGLLGTSLYKMAKDIPGHPMKLAADYSHNFLKGFYGQGVGKFKQGQLVAKEGMKATGRMAKGIVSPFQTIAYKQTGIAPHLYKQYLNSEKQIESITKQFIKGGLGFDEAKNQIRNLEKQIHFKLTNDYSNNYFYGTRPKKPLYDYANKYVKLSSPKAFKKAAGGKEIANYVASRQPGISGYKGATYLKYTTAPWSDVLRGAQFDRNFYNAMLKLKNAKSLDSAVITMKSVFPGSGVDVRKGKLLFNMSPGIRPDFDWGGYNAVGIWDPKDKGKIRIIATDKRDLFGVKFGGKDMINYVDSKEVGITEAAKEYKKVSTPVKERKGSYAPRRYDPEYRENVQAPKLRVGGTRNILGNELIKPFSAYNNALNRTKGIVKKPNLFNVSGRRKLAKIAPSLLKRGGLAGATALGIWALARKLTENNR